MTNNAKLHRKVSNSNIETAKIMHNVNKTFNSLKQNSI